MAEEKIFEKKRDIIEQPTLFRGLGRGLGDPSVHLTDTDRRVMSELNYEEFWRLGACRKEPCGYCLDVATPSRHRLDTAYKCG